MSTRPLPATTGTQQRPYSVYSAEPATKSDEPRYTRRGVIAGLAAVAATVLVGAGLLERLTQAGASTTDQTASAQAATTGTQSQSNGSGQTDGTSGQSSDATGSSGAGGAANGATQTLVSVDAASCVGCGRCLSVCPVSLFSWDSSGQRATAQNPGRCIRCHRCLQVCPANAITING